MSQTEANVSRAHISELVQAWHKVPGGLMPALWSIQNTVGYIPSEAVPEIANVLNLSVAEVHGVISFYHDFKTQPPAAHTIKLCQAEACQAMGARALQAFAEQRLGVKLDERGSSVNLESVYCLGLCACAPAVMVDGQLKARVTEQSLGEFIDECDMAGGAELG